MLSASIIRNPAGLMSRSLPSPSRIFTHSGSLSTIARRRPSRSRKPSSARWRMRNCPTWLAITRMVSSSRWSGSRTLLLRNDSTPITRSSNLTG